MPRPLRILVACVGGILGGMFGFAAGVLPAFVLGWVGTLFSDDPGATAGAWIGLGTIPLGTVTGLVFGVIQGWKRTGGMDRE